MMRWSSLGMIVLGSTLATGCGLLGPASSPPASAQPLTARTLHQHDRSERGRTGAEGAVRRLRVRIANGT